MSFAPAFERPRDRPTCDSRLRLAAAAPPSPTSFPARTTRGHDRTRDSWSASEFRPKLLRTSANPEPWSRADTLHQERQARHASCATPSMLLASCLLACPASSQAPTFSTSAQSATSSGRLEERCSNLWRYIGAIDVAHDRGLVPTYPPDP